MVCLVMVLVESMGDFVIERIWGDGEVGFDVVRIVLV